MGEQRAMMGFTAANTLNWITKKPLLIAVWKNVSTEKEGLSQQVTTSKNVAKSTQESAFR